MTYKFKPEYNYHVAFVVVVIVLFAVFFGVGVLIANV